MWELESKNIDILPLPYEYRHKTDRCCTIYGVTFSLIMFIVTFFAFDKGCYLIISELYLQIIFPADTNGKLCGIDLSGYNYVYFTRAPKMGQRVCVSKCPGKSDSVLSCASTDNIDCRFSNNTGVEVQYIDTHPYQTKTGFYCYPTDEEVKKQLLQNTNLKQWDKIINNLSILLIACLGFSIIYLLFVQCLPAYTTIFTFVGIIINVILTVYFFFSAAGFQFKWLIILIFIVKTVLFNKNDWPIHRIFMKQATFIVMQRMYLLIYIPIFMILTGIFMFIMTLTFICYWGTGYSTFDPEKNLFHQLHGGFAGFMAILWFIQFLWGLNFLKEAFNFVVSCVTVDWYFEKDGGLLYPLKLLTVKHLGSVIGTAFMASLLLVFNYIFDFMSLNVSYNSENCIGCMVQAFCIPCSKSLGKFVRSDTFAYISLTGNPYCNSCQYCLYLCDKSYLFDKSQATDRASRITIHLLFVCLVILISIQLDEDLYKRFGLLIFSLSILISTYFISFHSSIAMSILIIFALYEQLIKRQKNQFFDFDFAFQFRRSQDLQIQLRNLIIERKSQRQKEIRYAQEYSS